MPPIAVVCNCCGLQLLWFATAVVCTHSADRCGASLHWAQGDVVDVPYVVLGSFRNAAVPAGLCSVSCGLCMLLVLAVCEGRQSVSSWCMYEAAGFPTVKSTQDCTALYDLNPHCITVYSPNFASLSLPVSLKVPESNGPGPACVLQICEGLGYCLNQFCSPL
jgi:hypothetical protein